MAKEIRERNPKGNDKSGFIIDPDEQWLRRRLPRHLPKRNNDIYLNSNSNFKNQKVRAVGLLHESGWVLVHGLGSGVPYAINLALTLQTEARTPTVVDTRTSTVYLTEDVEPTYGAAHYDQAKGHAAVHIKVSLKEIPTKEASAKETEKKKERSTIVLTCLSEPKVYIFHNMFFSLWELTTWLGVTILEMFIWLTALLVTLVLVVLRVEGVIPHLSWWVVLAPMFIADALNTYFCVIVLIRMYLDGVLKPAALRALWSFSVLTLGFIFKFLLCKKLVKSTEFEYSAVMSPVFILLQLIMIRACHLN